MSNEPALRAIQAHQLGLITVAQAGDAGITRKVYRQLGDRAPSSWWSTGARSTPSIGG